MISSACLDGAQSILRGQKNSLTAALVSRSLPQLPVRRLTTDSEISAGFQTREP